MELAEISILHLVLNLDGCNKSTKMILNLERQFYGKV